MQQRHQCPGDLLQEAHEMVGWGKSLRAHRLHPLILDMEAVTVATGTGLRGVRRMGLTVASLQRNKLLPSLYQNERVGPTQVRTLKYPHSNQACSLIRAFFSPLEETHNVA